MIESSLVRQLFMYDPNQDKEALDVAINLYLEDNQEECNYFSMPFNSLVRLTSHEIMYFMESISKQNYKYIIKGKGIYLNIKGVEDLLIKSLGDEANIIIDDMQRYVLRLPYEISYDLEYGSYLNKNFGFIRTNFVYMVLKKYNKEYQFLNIYKYNDTVMKSDYKKQIIRLKYFNHSFVK